MAAVSASEENQKKYRFMCYFSTATKWLADCDQQAYLKQVGLQYLNSFYLILDQPLSLVASL